MKTLKSKIEDKKDNKNNQMDTFGGLLKELSTSFVFPLFVTAARLSPLMFFDGYENGPKALFAYCMTGATVDMAEAINRVYVKNELGPIPPLNGEYNLKKAQAEWDLNKEEHMSLAKPYSCFEKHIFYDLPKKIYNSIKERKVK